MSNILKNRGGRPEINYPYLWEMYHIQWEKGDITEKNMIEWLGLKKTTLYKLSKKYKKELYKDKMNTVLEHEQLVLKYILENKEFDKNFHEEIFCINHDIARNALKISSPAIINILKKLENKNKIIKIKKGIWKLKT
ncbi:hypothetical protein [Clostridium estertheticum]|uniref:hypothetical protein n=1 Tax=Clostridium estertheticum TaxID=238834 RepID=UPI001C7DE2F7|nr:hypothetical protein [Clostridium estertheticum]MBX4272122.1 hypothetical protein [Clostridium estertheticum]WLC82499.1 hypothetical protein KTC98_24400 [Clostridium estertheticum]